MFKKWLEEQEILQPYYRIVNKAMYGGSAQEKLGDILAPGTYWTPRWDSILMMMRTILSHYRPSLDEIGWETTVYQLNKAIMADPPKEHKWAFRYAVDAGEQILVKALEKPTIARDPKTGIKIERLHPMLNSEFIEIITNTDIKLPVDWESHGVKAILDGKMVFIGWDYDDAEITINVKDGWQFKKILSIRSSREWNELLKKLKIIDTDSQALDGLSWFPYDMGQEKEKGNPKAQGWE